MMQAPAALGRMPIMVPTGNTIFLNIRRPAIVTIGNIAPRINASLATGALRADLSMNFPAYAPAPVRIIQLARMMPMISSLPKNTERNSRSKTICETIDVNPSETTATTVCQGIFAFFIFRVLHCRLQGIVVSGLLFFPED